MNLQTLGKIDKGWGFELVFANNDKYCGKLLVFDRAGSKTSLVLHKEKYKSWFINAGKFKVTYIDVATGETKEAILEEGKTATRVGSSMLASSRSLTSMLPQVRPEKLF